MKLWPRLALAATLVRLTIRDRFPLLDVLHYVTPWPVIAGLRLVGLVARQPFRKAGALALGLLAAVVIGWSTSRTTVAATVAVETCST